MTPTIILLVVAVAILIAIAIKQFTTKKNESLGEVIGEGNFDLILKNTLNEALSGVNAQLQEDSKKTQQIDDFLNKTMSGQIENVQSALKTALETSSASIREDLSHSASNEEKMLQNIGVIHRSLTGTTKRGKGAEKQIAEMFKRVGLRPGIDFEEQARIMIAGQSRLPDFVMNLPKGKKIIVDSKSPLNKYMEMIEAEDRRAMASAVDEKEILTTINDAKKQFISGIKKHIKDLGDKNYHDADGSIGNAVMLISNEAVVTFIHNEAPHLIEDAEERNIVIMSPAQFTMVVSIFKEMVELTNAQKAISHILQEHKNFKSLWANFQDNLGGVSKELSKFSKSFASLRSDASTLEDQVVAIDVYERENKENKVEQKKIETNGASEIHTNIPASMIKTITPE